MIDRTLLTLQDSVTIFIIITRSCEIFDEITLLLLHYIYFNRKKYYNIHSWWNMQYRKCVLQRRHIMELFINYLKEQIYVHKVFKRLIIAR